MNTVIPMYRRRTANRDRAADTTRHAVASAPTRPTPRSVRSNFPNIQKSKRRDRKPESRAARTPPIGMIDGFRLLLYSDWAKSCR
jgi:hypothetical protein